ncbi:MAG TPA: benzoate-CoA ligase family protein [Gammaproteobacteria bacterium]|nr:benzoate-CoA ligase family protein [Gammaproteobacteria bacterium]
MTGLSTVRHAEGTPVLELPRDYNAAHDLVERNLLAGRGEKIAYIDDGGCYSFRELAARVNRASNALRALGLGLEDRIVLALEDTIDFPSVFLGAIKAGIVPVAVNTLLKPADYAFMLKDCRAKALVVAAPLLPAFEAAIAASPFLVHAIVAGGEAGPGRASLAALMAAAAPEATTAPTTRDDACFWLYSSGSTGTPKGTVHVHSSPIHTAELYARAVLGLREDDVVFSAAKLFFAYGLGNSLSFPLAVGATTVLTAERPTPAAVYRRLVEHRPTVFCGVPTLYAGMLAHAPLPPREALALRICTSAGEALPAEVGRRFTAQFGVEVLDGIGSTEMLHIFLSNRPGDVRYGTTGKPVPGYRLRLVGDDGREVAPGELGELQISGPSSAIMYWNARDRSRATFIGEWTRAGDKYSIDADGYYVYGGRSDDMLKVSGQYVSPFEVEAALTSHPAVLECAVIGVDDEEGLTKPKAVVVLKPGLTEDHAALAQALQQHVKERLAAFKYPRSIAFVDELPKTATGKIQRFRLRELEGMR